MSDQATFRVAEHEAGERLDIVLAERLAVSRSQAGKRLAAGDVEVDGRPAAKGLKVQAGQRVRVAMPAERRRAAAPPAPPVRYEDDQLLVVSKPAGLVTHPGAGTPDGTLVQALEAAGVPLAPAGGDVRPGIVHRLDKDTSGLLVVAKSDGAFHGLVAALKDRRVERRYLALVEGSLPTTVGRVEAPIGRDPGDRKRFACVPDGKPAVTHWEQLADGPLPAPLEGHVALVRCRLGTGRTHQIRVHLAYAGHPVVGDRTYGARRDVPAHLDLERLFLHAHELRFTHPVTGADVAVTEPLPDDLAAALAGIGMEEPAGAGP